jgi:hypothetical protein
MSWGKAVTLRLVAFAVGVYFVWLEAEGTYEFLLADQSGVLNFTVKAGTGFAVVAGVLPMYAGVLFKARQWLLGAVCWLTMPVVLGVVFYAAINRTGGDADRHEAMRLENTRAGTLAAQTHTDARKTWEDAREAALKECVKRGRKCLEAEAKRDSAWNNLQKAKTELLNTNETRPDASSRRVAAAFHLVTEDQVRLYQPMMIPLGMSLVASLFMSIAMLLYTPPPPWLGWWAHWMAWRSRENQEAAPHPAPARIEIQPTVIDMQPEVVAEAHAVQPETKTTPPPVRESGRRPVAQAKPMKVARQLALMLGRDVENPKNALEIEEIFDEYAARRRVAGESAVDPDQFFDDTLQLCRQERIKTRKRGDKIYLLGVKFMSSPVLAPPPVVNATPSLPAHPSAADIDAGRHDRSQTLETAPR